MCYVWYVPLASLPALAATKGVDKKTTLMDYLTVMVDKKDPGLLNFAEELSLLSEARRYVFSDLKGDVAKLSGKLAALQQEAAAELRDIEAAASSASSAEATGAAPAPAPAKAVGGDGRNAMLAELMAKRAGGAAAASSSPAVSSGSGATSAAREWLPNSSC